LSNFFFRLLSKMSSFLEKLSDSLSCSPPSRRGFFFARTETFPRIPATGQTVLAEQDDRKALRRIVMSNKKRDPSKLFLRFSLEGTSIASSSLFGPGERGLFLSAGFAPLIRRGKARSRRAGQARGSRRIQGDAMPPSGVGRVPDGVECERGGEGSGVGLRKRGSWGVLCHGFAR
jgi:hypothetical protein